MYCLFRKFDTLRRFGVELEVGNEIKKDVIRRHILSISDKDVCTSRYNLSINNSYWHVKDDSTCGIQGKNGPKGIEIASFIASGIQDLNHICDVADYLKEKGVKVNHNCGLHIHIDAADLSEEQVGNILHSWIKIEPFIALSLPFRRINNPYCKMICHSDIIIGEKNFSYLKLSPEKIYNILSPNNLDYYENNDRRVTLNLVNYCRAIKYKNNNRRTIELRWPEGTLDSNEIKNWVVLFLNFIEYAKEKLSLNYDNYISVFDAMSILGLGHSSEFVILSEDLFCAKIWLLQRIINNVDLEKCRSSMKLPFVSDSIKKECIKYLNFFNSFKK